MAEQGKLMTRGQRIVVWLVLLSTLGGIINMVFQLKYVLDALALTQGEDREVLLVSLYAGGLLTFGCGFCLVYGAYMLFMDRIHRRYHLSPLNENKGDS